MIRTNNSIVNGRIRSRRIISSVVTVTSNPEGSLYGGPGDMCVDTTRNWLYVKTTDLGLNTGWEFLAGDQDTGWRGWDHGDGWYVDVPDEGTFKLHMHQAYRRIGDAMIFGVGFKITSMNANYPAAEFTIGPGPAFDFPYVESYASVGGGELYEGSGVRATAVWKIPWSGATVRPQVLVAINDAYLQEDTWYFISSGRMSTGLSFPDVADYGGDPYTPPTESSEPVFG